MGFYKTTKFNNNLFVKTHMHGLNKIYPWINILTMSGRSETHRYTYQPDSIKYLKFNYPQLVSEIKCQSE